MNLPLFLNKIKINEINWHKIGKITGIFSICFGGTLTIRKILDVVWRKWKNYPPGPCGIPILGSYFNAHKYTFAASITNSYGPVTMIYFGLRRLVFIGDQKMCKKFFKLQDGSDRDDVIVSPDIRTLFETKFSSKFVFRRQLMHTNTMRNVVRTAGHKANHF